MFLAVVLAWLLVFISDETGQLNFGGIGNMGGLLRGLIPGGRSKPGANIFKKTLSGLDWNLAAGVLCPAGVWTVIGQYVVPAQQAYRFGFGSAQFPDNQGYIYLAVFDDTGATSEVENGTIRLVQRNAQGTVSLVVAEFRTEQLYGAVADRQMQIALPEQTQFPLVGEDSVLEIQFMADDEDITVLWGAAIAAAPPLVPVDACNIPVTVYQ